MSDSYEMADWSTGAQCVFERIAEKWTLHVVARLMAGPTHFLALQRRLGGISKKVLTETLRRLERDGLVTRRPEPHQSTVEYSLTPLGQSLAGPLDALRRWSEEHEAVVEDARQRFDAARAAGKPAEGRIQT
jgi:DNA-binding HxlR family transcriptional regulator